MRKQTRRPEQRMIEKSNTQYVVLVIVVFLFFLSFLFLLNYFFSRSGGEKTADQVAKAEAAALHAAEAERAEKAQAEVERRSSAEYSPIDEYPLLSLIAKNFGLIFFVVMGLLIAHLVLRHLEMM